MLLTDMFIDAETQNNARMEVQLEKTAEQYLQAIYVQCDTEFRLYKDNLSAMPPAVIIQHSEETYMKQAILTYLQESIDAIRSTLTPSQIAALWQYNMNNSLLNYLYDYWCTQQKRKPNFIMAALTEVTSSEDEASMNANSRKM